MPFLSRPERFWPAFWASIVVVLGVVIAIEHYFGGVDVGEGARVPAKVVEAKLLPPFTLPPEAEVAPETTARPLFVPTRRPSPPLATAAPSTMKRGQYVLTGVTVTPDAAFAFLKEVAGGKTKSVRKGTQVNGLTVETVEPRRVVLRQGEELEELSLNIQVPPRMVAAPAPSATVPPAPGAVPVPPGSAVPPARTSPAGIVPPGFPGGTSPASAPTPSGTPPPPPSTTAPVTGRRRPWINAQ
jgi:hypothetical protein